MNQSSRDSAEPSPHVIVVVPDVPGTLGQVTEVLAKAEVNIEAIDGNLISEFGVITLNTSNNDAALHALLEADFRAVTSESVVFHLEDRPGALATVAQLFGSHQLNVRTIHIVHRLGGHAIVAVTTDDNGKARSLLDSNSLL